MNNQGLNTIYCDESGFTGNDLFFSGQPFFVYSSIAIDAVEAKDVVQKVQTDFKLQGQELKGSNLLGSTRGKEAIVWILERYANNTCIMTFDKKYALAAKFYEYIFEPVLSDNSSLFYAVGFHRYISNILYLYFLAKHDNIEKILVDFQNTMRYKDFANLETALNAQGTNERFLEFLHQVSTFAVYHKEIIIAELKSLQKNESVSSWPLELTLTALFNILAKWGQKIEGMEVYCDDSKPLVSQGDFLDVMVNRKDKAFLKVEGKSHPMSFNLARPIRLVNSKEFHGIQLADIFASSIAYALNYHEDDFSRRCMALCEGSIHENSIFPQIREYADPLTRHSFVNTGILTELYKRTVERKNILKNMEGHIAFLESIYPEWYEKYK